VILSLFQLEMSQLQRIAASGNMPGLLELPSELLLNIASFLGGSHGAIHQAALANFCLASQRLRDIAQPLLYAAPRLALSRGPDPLRQLWTFARSVLQDPALAARVRSLIIEAPAYADEPELIKTSQFDVDRCGAIKSAAESQRGSHMFVHRLASLLILPLENLGNLHLRLSPKHNCYTMSILQISLASTNRSRTPELRSLNLEEALKGTAEVSTGCELIGFSTSLEELRVESLKFIAPGFDNSGFRMQPHTSALVELQLRKCHISPSTLEHWIGSCRSLRTFTYTATYCAQYDVEAAQLLEALRSCAGTLERLDVDFSEHYVYESEWTAGPYWDASSVIKYEGFGDFTKLEDLRIEAARLKDVDTLPPCLKTLTLTVFEVKSLSDDIRRRLIALRNLRREQCPALKSVRLQYGRMVEVEMQSMVATFHWTDEEHIRERDVEIVPEYNPDY
jgi:hypothetical protein